MASGDTLAVFFANHGEPPTANFATLDTRAGAANASHLVLDFDAATDESMGFSGWMPGNYAGGGLTVTIAWMASTATTGDVVWDFAFKSFTDDVDDIDTKAFAAAKSVTTTTASASGELKYSTITFTDGAEIDSIAIREYFRVRLTRDADNVADTMAGDAEVLVVAIRET